MYPRGDLHQKVASFRVSGYALFERFHDSDFVTGWRALADAATKSAMGRKLVLGDFWESAPDLALRACTIPALLQFAEAVLGPFVQLDGLTLVIAPPPSIAGGSAEGIDWHRDPWSGFPRGNEYQHPLALNALTYLQSLNDQTGPLRIIPGSHRMEISIPTALRSQPHALETLLSLNAGDLIVMDNRLIHSRSANTSPDSRCYVSAFLSRSWLRSSQRYDNPALLRLRDQARQNNDRRTMRLFGVDEQLAERTNSGFLTDDEDCWKEWIREDEAAYHGRAKR